MDKERLEQRTTAIMAVNSADAMKIAEYAAELEAKNIELKQQVSGLSRIGRWISQHAHEWLGQNRGRMNVSEAAILVMTRMLDRVEQADAGFEKVERFDPVGQARPKFIDEEVLTVLMTDLLGHLTLKQQLKEPTSALAYMIQWAHRRAVRILYRAYPRPTVSPRS